MYENVNGFIIIEADNRDPKTSFRNHRKRKSYGGVDCVAPIGTPILAPDDCVIHNIPNNGTGGNTIQLSFQSGWVDQMMHLSRFVSPGQKRKREVIGYSGDSAAPYNPHVHWHRLGVGYTDEFGWTNRYNPFDYFVTPTIEQEMEAMYSIIPDAQSNTIFVASLVTGKRIGIVSPSHIGLLERFRANKGNDRMLQVEMDIVRGYLSLISGENDNGPILDALKNLDIDNGAEADFEEFARLLGNRIAGVTVA